MYDIMNGLGAVKFRRDNIIRFVLLLLFFCVCYVILVLDKDLCSWRWRENITSFVAFVLYFGRVNDAMENHHLLDLYLSGVQFNIRVWWNDIVVDDKCNEIGEI